MSPTVRIDEEVYEKLKENAEPFVDTPNTVLRRLLGLGPAGSSDLQQAADTDADESADALLNESNDGLSPQVRPPSPAAGRPRKAAARKATVKKKARRTRVPSGALLPEERYWLPLLTALVEFGGHAPYRQLVDRVGELLKNDLTDLDLAPLNTGGIRWQSRLQFVRLRLVEQGLMVRESGRGVWAISEEGRKYVEQHESGMA
jgi:hypothetical protein